MSTVEDWVVVYRDMIGRVHAMTTERITDDDGDELEHGEPDFPGQFPDPMTREDTVRAAFEAFEAEMWPDGPAHGSGSGIWARHKARIQEAAGVDVERLARALILAMPGFQRWTHHGGPMSAHEARARTEAMETEARTVATVIARQYAALERASDV